MSQRRPVASPPVGARNSLQTILGIGARFKRQAAIGCKKCELINTKNGTKVWFVENGNVYEGTYQGESASGTHYSVEVSQETTSQSVRDRRGNNTFTQTNTYYVPLRASQIYLTKLDADAQKELVAQEQARQRSAA